jgi:outer membrane protein assembly factor BamB
MLAFSACSSFNNTWLSFLGTTTKKPAVLTDLKTNNASVAWSASLGKSKGYLFVPAFADKLIYVASNDGTVSALADEGGRLVTRMDAKSKLTGGAGAAENMVAVANDKGEVLAFDAAGRQLWKVPVAGEVLAPPTITASNVIVRTADGRIFALARSDGQRKWVFQRALPPLTLRTNAGVLINRGTIYAGYPGGKLIAIEADSGKPTWEATISLPRGATELERIADVSGLPVLDDTRICAAVYQGRTGCVETLNGNVLWSREVSSAEAVAIDSRYLYAVDTEGNVHALDKSNGASVWKQDKLLNRDPGSPVILNGKLVVGDSKGLVHVISADSGDLIGRVSTDGSRVISLVQYRDRAIAQTDKGGVFAIAVK